MSVEQELAGFRSTLEANTTATVGNTAAITDLSRKVGPMHEDWTFRQRLRKEREDKRKRLMQTFLLMSIPLGIIGTLIGLFGNVTDWFK